MRVIRPWASRTKATPGPAEMRDPVRTEGERVAVAIGQALDPASAIEIDRLTVGGDVAEALRIERVQGEIVEQLHLARLRVDDDEARVVEREEPSQRAGSRHVARGDRLERHDR